jgi:hypothetical protein
VTNVKNIVSKNETAYKFTKGTPHLSLLQQATTLNLSGTDMVRIRFIGRIYPSAMDVSMTNFPSIHWGDPGLTDLGIDARCHVQIENNNVAVDIDLNKFDATEHLTPISMRAYDTVRSAIDLICFASGNGHTFLMETWIDAEGNVRACAPQQPDLALLSTAVMGPVNFHNVVQFVITNPPLFMALRDLIDGITQWHQAPITVARSVERLRHLVLPDEPDRKKQWKRLGELLQLTDSYTKVIRDTSTAPRHGDFTHIPGAIVSDAATRAWIIMNRYLEFRKRGGIDPLPVSEFPLLT